MLPPEGFEEPYFKSGARGCMEKEKGKGSSSNYNSPNYIKIRAPVKTRSRQTQKKT
jgi:hypothetical protein